MDEIGLYDYYKLADLKKNLILGCITKKTLKIHSFKKNQTAVPLLGRQEDQGNHFTKLTYYASSQLPHLFCSELNNCLYM